MVTHIPNLASHFSIFIILMSLTTILATGKTNSFIKPLDRKALQLGKEKLSHFQVYWHDIVSGSTPTSVAVTNGQKNSSTGFGTIRMIDNRLTEGPELKSKLIGRAQGFYGSTGQETISLLMSMNFVFLVGKYNGSTITVHGRNEVFNKVREMPVIGGSGLFRFARGYVQASTHTFDLKTGDAIVLYNF